MREAGCCVHHHPPARLREVVPLLAFLNTIAKQMLNSFLQLVFWAGNDLHYWNLKAALLFALHDAWFTHYTVCSGLADIDFARNFQFLLILTKIRDFSFAVILTLRTVTSFFHCMNSSHLLKRLSLILIVKNSFLSYLS